MRWGHVRSRDLAHWEHLPIAPWPSKELGEDHVFSGCDVLTKDRPMMFYTTIGRGKGAGVHAEQWSGVGSDDLLANGRECVTRVVEGLDPEARIELFATGGPATVRSFEVWLLRSIW